MKVKIDEKQEDISISVSGKKYDEEELKNAFQKLKRKVETSCYSEKNEKDLE